VALQVAQQYRRDTMSPVIVSGVMRLVEFAVLLLSGLQIYAGYVGLGGELSWEYPLVITGVSLLAVILLEVLDAYQMPALRNPLSQAGRIFLTWSAAFALLIVGLFFLKVSAQFSRFWLGTWYAAGLLLMLILRLAAARLIRRWARNGRIERRAVIVGGGKNAETLIRAIEQQPYNDIRICGIFDDRDDTRSPPVVAGYPKLGNIDELIAFARIARIDMLIVSLPISAEARVLSLL